LARFSSDQETRLVAAFFGNIKGYYVEVGANDPRERSQTWHLEQLGWTGVLIEPQADLAAALRAERKGKVFAVACSSPAKAGQELSLYVAGPLSSLDRRSMAPGAIPEKVIRVPVRTLDSILEEAGSPAAFDFLSIDVEGHEIEVLQGFDLARWRPRLIMIEDHVADLSKHRYLNAAGYRIVRRYENNGWYVPRDSAVACRWADRWEILRKYYLALPFRMLRNLSREVRKPVRD
jgi:FkbM family methyltransferase